MANVETGHTNIKLTTTLIIGVVLRIICYFFVGESLNSRVELSSPLVSFESVQDGVALLKEGISPYAGDSVHIQPILLHLFHCLLKFPAIYTITLFIFMDSLTAYIIGRTALKFAGNNQNWPYITAASYILNPVTIASCSVCSLSVLYNLLLSLFVYFFTTGSIVWCSVFLSILGHLTLYHYILIGSILLRFKGTDRINSISVIACLSGFLCLTNYILNGFNWNFIEDTYMFMYYVNDLTPNVGVFWYFFTQVFEHFRFFFISVFQINLLVYLVPLFLTIRNDNHLHLIISMLLITVFSPYPTLNDAAVYMAFLPTLDKYWKQPMRFVLPVSCAVISCIVLMPVMWHMWIISGSGNANFYFAVTLIYNLAQVYLLGDLLFAYFRSEASKVSDNFIGEATSFIFH